DFLAGVAVVNVGHCHPDVVAAVTEQVGRLIHVSNLAYTEPQLVLAQRISERSLGGRVFFCNSGAEAVEGALKLARKARRGGEIVSVHGAFHGRTFGALSATPQEAKQQPFAPLVPRFRAVPPTAEALRAAVAESTAAVLLEVVQGESGVHVLGDEVLVAARELCDATGALLIFDEVQTGMGRTGTLWAWEQTPVRPDVMTLAKGLGGGLPIGAIVTAPAYGDVLEPGDHGSTFAGGPVAASAALAAFGVLSDPELLERVRALGERLRSGLAELPGAVDVRGRGLMSAFDLAAGQGAPALVGRALAEQRLVLNATGPATVRLIPPLVVGEAEVDEALARLRALL
ncbi:MAG TPA: aminotransferase class III-fold pyridoxal phosphate-dependent enzyme, partial [Solirubrobacteraceae bacterium]